MAGHTVQLPAEVHESGCGESRDEWASGGREEGMEMIVDLEREEGGAGKRFGCCRFAVWCEVGGVGVRRKGE